MCVTKKYLNTYGKFKKKTACKSTFFRQISLVRSMKIEIIIHVLYNN